MFYKIKYENHVFDQCDVCMHFRSWRKYRFSCAIFDYFKYRNQPCPKFLLNQDEVNYILAIRQWSEKRKLGVDARMPLRTPENIQLKSSICG